MWPEPGWNFHHFMPFGRNIQDINPEGQGHLRLRWLAGRGCAACSGASAPPGPAIFWDEACLKMWYIFQIWMANHRTERGTTDEHGRNQCDQPLADGARPDRQGGQIPERRPGHDRKAALP